MTSPSRTQAQKDTRAISAVGEVDGAQSRLPRPRARRSSNLAAASTHRSTAERAIPTRVSTTRATMKARMPGKMAIEQREDAVERLMERIGHMVPDRSVVGDTGAAKPGSGLSGA
jgi:hypothetical protein